MKLDVVTVGGNHPIRFVIEDASPEQEEALAILAERHGHIVTPLEVAEVLVEVDVPRPAHLKCTPGPTPGSR